MVESHDCTVPPGDSTAWIPYTIYAEYDLVVYALIDRRLRLAVGQKSLLLEAQRAILK